MPQHLVLPNELLFTILADVLSYSIHISIVADPDDIDWHLDAHHILSSVCYSFREIVDRISCKVFQYSPNVDANDTPSRSSLIQHVRRQQRGLRFLAKAIRDPVTPGASRSFSIENLDTNASQLVQGYSLYIAIIYLRAQAARSTAEIYHATSSTILGAIVTLSQVLYNRIGPSEAAVLLKEATQAEAELSRIGVSVMNQTTILAEQVEALALAGERDDDVVHSHRLKAEQSIKLIAAADAEFLALYGRSIPFPCCSLTWPAQLPDVQSIVQRICEALDRMELVGVDSHKQLRTLFERWTSSGSSPVTELMGLTATAASAPASKLD